MADTAPLVSHRTRQQVSAGARYALGAVLVGALAFAMWQVRSVLLLIFLGLLLAAGLDPVVQRMTRRGLRRGWAVLVLLLGIFAVIVLFMLVAASAIVDQTVELVESLPALVEDLASQFPQLQDVVDRFDIGASLQSIAQQVPSVLNVSFGILSGVASGLFAAFTVTALTAYFMLALPRILDRASTVLRHPDRVKVLSDAVGRVGGYVTGQTLISVAAGVTAFVFLTAVGAPYAALLALVVGLLDLVPQVGATIGAFIAVTVTVAADGFGKALVVAAFFLVYQQLENYVIAPRVFASTVNLSPLVAFISILIGASLAGVIGAIFALPVAAMIKTVAAYALRDRLPPPPTPRRRGLRRPDIDEAEDAVDPGVAAG
jgi:predicted PurR-regulated permease PerM